MPSQPRTRGRLPARVYWVRRTMVLGTVLALAFAFAHLLDRGDSAKTSGQATIVAAGPSTSPTGAAGPLGPTPVIPTSTATAKPKATATAPLVLAEPDGPCAAEEVTVKPVDGTAPAGTTVPLVLQLTGTRPACTFEVGRSTVVAKVFTANGKVWSTQDCPSAIPASTVVVRSAAPTTIQLSWSGRRSDAGCTRSTAWALPATYQVKAAAIGSEPSTGSMKLTVPERPVVVKTIQPKPNKNQSTAPTTPDTGH
ncbi:MAG: hypothetical protein EOO67_11700 [Microbacterium sp.]|nr:MAG: hypothetical protein EOO67_11700 [Microbacterium sp.]